MSYGIMYSIHKIWNDKIFSGEKTLEFRTKLPKDLKPGTKIYLYETKKGKGCGKVVGECRVNNIIPVLSDTGEWPAYGCYPFMEYFFNNVVGDFELADYIGKIKEEFKDKFANYKHGFILHYVMSEENLDSIRKSGLPINTWKICDITQVNKILADLEASDKLIEMCDEWLKSIGYYNDIDECYYKWGLVLGEVIKYEKSIPASNFVNKNGERIKKGPQSYCYAERL